MTTGRRRGGGTSPLPGIRVVTSTANWPPTHRYLGRPLASSPLHAPDDPRYAALWDASPGRTAFDHPAAVAAFSDAFGLHARILAVEEDDAWTAAVPVYEKRRGPFVASALPPLCPVHRPLLTVPLAEAASHRALQ